MMGKEAPAGNQPLGSLREVRKLLADFNTAPDGAPSKGMGTDFLYGPGFTVELPTTNEFIQQAIVSVVEEDIALPVLMNACRKLGWRMLDMESGRTFGG